MSELPKNWTWSNVGVVTAYIQRGKSPKYAATSALPVINQKCIRWSELQLQHLKYIHPEQISAWDEPRFIRPGDILWNSTGTGTVGRAYLVKEADCTPAKVVDSHVTIVRAAKGLEPRYLFNWIKSPAVQNKIEEMCDGTTNQIELSRTAIAETAIPVAPREEQTRIADHLDTLLARIKACNDHLDAIPGLLKRFRQAVLNAALAGLLDDEEDYRQIVRISEVASVGTGSTPLRSNRNFYASTGLPWVTSAATSAPYVSAADQFVTPAAIAAHRLKIYPKGTLLVAMYGEGKTRGQVSELAIDATINQACAAISVDEDRTSKGFVKMALAANYFAMRELAEGGNQPNLNLSKIKAFEIPLPSLEAQSVVVKRVNELLGSADRVEARYTATRFQVDRLAPRVLAKAFRGELVPQDPNDEPASALLARLAAERSQSVAAPKTRQARAPRATRSPKPLSPANAMPNKSRQDEDVKGQPYLAGHLSRLGQPVDAKTLYEASELLVADFYKQLAWEIAQGHVNDADPLLEPARHAA